MNSISTMSGQPTPAAAGAPGARGGSALMVATLVAFMPVGCGGTPLDLRFIGNEAFEISDGRITLLTDFPYRSGYSGYMTYDASAVRPEGRVVTLVTHRHLDHFDPSSFLETAWEIVGPEEVTRSLPPDRVVPFQRVVSVNGITIRPVRTPHRDTEHYSYLVEWGGRRLYFVGDTEDAGALLDMRGLDYAFVTPWLWDTVRRGGKRVDARRIVIYHHTAGQPIPDCAECWIPRQGDRLGVGR
jgi:L-ascorbate metabolism protein UlaG (beta-lactamase superfamily)